MIGRKKDRPPDRLSGGRFCAKEEPSSAGGGVRLLCLPARTFSAGLRGPGSAASAAHLAGILLGTVVGGHVTAVVGVGAVAVQGGVSAAVAGEVQGTAVDGQVSVGVYAVSCGHNGEESSIDENEAAGVGGLWAG